MSYRGRPSKGCEGCRARKVKCDEAKPSCGRCLRLGHQCQYRDQGDVLFRDQNTLAAQRAEGSWRKRAKSHQRSQSESSLIPSITTSTQAASYDEQIRPATVGSRTPEGLLFPHPPVRSAGYSSVPPPSTQDLLSLAYERFIYDFVASEDPNRSPEEPPEALLSFVPLLYQHAEPNSCLTSTVNAVAYMNFANRCNSLQAATLAEESFGKALRILSEVLTDPNKAASNDALCSAHLMGVFETLTDMQRQGTSTAHQHGAKALLQLRTSEQYYENHVSARLFQVSYSQMLLASLQTATYPAMPMKDSSGVRMNPPSLHNESENFVMRLTWEEAQLHAKWREVKQSEERPATRDDLLRILQTGLDLDSKYQIWEDTLSSAWGFESEPNTPEARSRYNYRWQKLVLTSRGAPAEIHRYANLKACSLWAYYRASRMFLLRDLLEILNWISRLPDQGHADGSDTVDELQLRSLQLSSTSKLVMTIEKTCAIILASFSVPMFKKSSEDIMGHLVLWALGTMDSILSSGFVPESSPSQLVSATRTSTPTETLQSAPSFYQDVSIASTQFGSTQSPIVAYHHLSGSQAEPLPTVRQEHPFDSMPRHPYDSPAMSPRFPNNLPEDSTMDVTGKREWINSMLYYIGTELGIKKALAVPVMEGYMPIVKPRVDEIIGF
ncbi:hypothetical protein IQ06DRAFT_319967 [Phaeosphaeriaceae sp. SRC1lsM3a]|nr:hypothetical protein IQ06DRAFT_319967 [Stagonospora sp. SRC1lsM3a]